MSKCVQAGAGGRVLRDGCVQGGGRARGKAK